MYGNDAVSVFASIGSDYYYEGYVTVVESVFGRSAARVKLTPDFPSDW
jgi:hypothetical protein